MMWPGLWAEARRAGVNVKAPGWRKYNSGSFGLEIQRRSDLSKETFEPKETSKANVSCRRNQNEGNLHFPFDDADDSKRRAHEMYPRLLSAIIRAIRGCGFLLILIAILAWKCQFEAK